MSTQTFTVNEREFEVKKINLLYRATSGKLPSEITSYIRAAFEGKKKETQIDQFKLMGEMYEFLESVVVKPKNIIDLFDELGQDEIMQLFVMIVNNVTDVEKLKKKNEEIEQAKN